MGNLYTCTCSVDDCYFYSIASVLSLCLLSLSICSSLITFYLTFWKLGLKKNGYLHIIFSIAISQGFLSISKVISNLSGSNLTSKIVRIFIEYSSTISTSFLSPLDVSFLCPFSSNEEWGFGEGGGVGGWGGRGVGFKKKRHFVCEAVLMFITAAAAISTKKSGDLSIVCSTSLPGLLC